MTSPSPLTPARGLNVLHLFCHPERDLDAGAVRKAVDGATQSGLQIVTAAIVGAKADTCFLVLGENLWDLRRFQSMIQAAGYHVAESYFSVTEVSEYAAGYARGDAERPALSDVAARRHERLLLLSHVQTSR